MSRPATFGRRTARTAAAGVALALAVGLSSAAVADEGPTLPPPTSPNPAAPSPAAPSPTAPSPTVPGPTSVVATAPTKLPYGPGAKVDVNVTRLVDVDGHIEAVPLGSAAVTLARLTGPGTWTPVASTLTDAAGNAAVTLRVDAGRYRLRASVDAGEQNDAGTSVPFTVQVTRAATTVKVPSLRVRSEQRTTLVARLTSPGVRDATAGKRVTVQSRPHGTARWSSARTRRVSAEGVLRLPVQVWRSTDFRVTFPGTTNLRPSRAQATVWTRSVLAPVRQYGPAPSVQVVPGPAPVGAGANARVSQVPDALWASMVGRTWSAGCPTGRSDLRLIRVNYWGFDGYRHSGEIVVADQIASATAAAFTDLYAQRFRIRSMHTEDRYGRNPLGPGADDYESMAADNTSGFNCRYVVGKESQRVWSPHAYGIAVDVNPWENPYVAPTGPFPNAHFLYHRNGPGVLTSAAVGAFTNRGFFWGGWWAHEDYQHFERD